MATLKQKKAFKEITENNRPVSVAMKMVDYAPSTTTKPSNLTNSKGWKELCETAGLTDSFLLGALKEDIDKKPQNRKPELELALRVTGHLKEKNDDNGDRTFNFVTVNYADHPSISLRTEAVSASSPESV